MAKTLQLRRGTTAEVAGITSAQGELLVDTDQKTVTVGDGSTAGGIYLAKEARVSGAWNTANGANGLAAGAFTTANGANGLAAGAYNTANGANGLAAGAYNTANGANGLAAGAYNTANTKFASSGGTISGSVAITQNLTVSGNVTITGNIVSQGATNLIIDDSIIYVANNNTGNTIDIGVVGNFTATPTGYQHTGLVRNSVNNRWRLFSNVVAEPTTTVDFTNAKYDDLQIGTLYGNVSAQTIVVTGQDLMSINSTQNTNITAVNGYASGAFTTANGANDLAAGAYNTANAVNGYAVSAYSTANGANGLASGAFLTANGANGLAAGAFTKANGAVQTAFVTVTANTTSLTPTSNNDTVTITGTSANGISVYSGAKTVGIGLVASGVASGVYGGSTQIPVITVDSFGRVTVAANTALSTSISLAGGTGTGSVAGGGTLTISGGTGITTSVTSSTFTITNSGVTSITGTSNQVTASASTGGVTLSLPQSINTTASVQFGSFGVGTAASGTTGEIRATNNITAYYSDKRLKNILHNIPNALDKVKTLNGVVFKQNEKAEEFGYNNYEEQVGVIAQEVQSVLPQVVKPAPFDLDENNQSKSGENYITVQYEKLVPLLIEAIKEQQKQIDELKSKIDNK